MRPPLVGIDLIEPERLQARLQRTDSLRRELFTDAELSYCEAQPAPDQHLAARFCAKEATAKALGLDGFDPLDIEIVSGGERVQLVLHGEVRERATALGVEVSISLTHLAGLAAAVALALPTKLWPE